MPRRDAAGWLALLFASFFVAVWLTPSAGEWVLGMWAVLVMIVGVLLLVLFPPSQ